MLKKRRASSFDVAALAGVSQSAVSRTFTPGAVVSAKMREKVLAAAARLHYRPNALARGLITQKSNIVALMIGNIDDPFYAKIVNIISNRLQGHGLHLLLFSVHGDHKAQAALEELLKFRVDGVLLVSTAFTSEMAQGCHLMGTPVVLYDRYAKDADVSSVRVDNVEGGRQVAKLLLDAEHRRIAFIAGTGIDDTSSDRERGFIAGLRASNTKLWRRAQGDYSFQSGIDCARALLRGEERPDAIFCASDLMALGAMEAARGEFRLRIPDDLSIVGFDDIPSAAWPSYRLTTIRQPAEALADEALSLLLAQIGDPRTKPSTRLIRGELIVRTSVRLPSG
jgi:DNA-binding LacI/PurR family transcriptional regulator